MNGFSPGLPHAPRIMTTCVSIHLRTLQPSAHPMGDRSFDESLVPSTGDYLILSGEAVARLVEH